MKRIILVVAFLLIPSIAFPWQATVVHITDGDTILVSRDGKTEKIRFYGIDAPEKKQAYGIEAKEFLSFFLTLQTVEVEEINIDKYGRTIGIVYLEEQNISELLVENGYAWVYKQYCKKDLCEDLDKFEINARKNKVGLWKDENPIAPWEWRKK